MFSEYVRAGVKQQLLYTEGLLCILLYRGEGAPGQAGRMGQSQLYQVQQGRVPGPAPE